MSLIQASVQSPFSCDLKYIYNLGSIQDRTKAMACPQKHQLPPLQEATATAGGEGAIHRPLQIHPLVGGLRLWEQRQQRHCGAHMGLARSPPEV